MRLFRRVIPWQCLGSVWSRRGSGSEISTVKATVKQFNHVVYIVLATVLSPCLSLQQRAKIVEKVLSFISLQLGIFEKKFSRFFSHANQREPIWIILIKNHFSGSKWPKKVESVRIFLAWGQLSRVYKPTPFTG